ncbi:MAG: F0F1 ATP synthase subunit epsilon [Gammaproteobacteria bacterium]|nr:F0F1 ATP synthase subunit epsilon [Gammaproteobacteria bacterium]
MKTPSTMKVTVVSQEAEMYSGEATRVYIRGAMGELGIAPGHLQLLTTIKPGPLRLIHGVDEQEELLYVSGGILEIQPDCVSILADTLERPQDVNEAAALEVKKAAEDLLLGQQEPLDRMRIQAELTEALAKLEVLELMRNRTK